MRIHHLALRTRDVTGLARFYEEVVGLALVKRADAPPALGKSVWLDAGGAIVMIEEAMATEPAVAHATMELTAAFTIAPSERTFVEDRLTKAGVIVEARTAYTLYFRDPDGRRIGVSAYPDPLG